MTILILFPLFIICFIYCFKYLFLFFLGGEYGIEPLEDLLQFHESVMSLITNRGNPPNHSNYGGNKGKKY